MVSASRTLKLLEGLLNALPGSRKKDLTLLFPLAVIVALSDVALVGLIGRLFTLVAGQPNNPPIPFNHLFPNDPALKVIGLVILYIGMNWIASTLKLILKARQFRLKALIWKDLSELALRNILTRPYESFISKKHSDVSTAILLIITRVSNIIVLPILQLISATVVIILISIAVLAIAKQVALYITISMLICYIIIMVFITPFLRFSNRQRILLEKETNNIFTESMRTIIDVHLTGSEGYFEKKYSSQGERVIPYVWKSELLPEMPRALLEPFGITLIFSIGMLPLIQSNSNTNLVDIVPFLATMAVASLKLTPPLQEVFQGVTALRAGLPDLEETLKIINTKERRITLQSSEVPSPKGIAPRKYIRLNHIDYSYPNSESLILKDVTLTIPVGGRVAFVGKTGSGKTTTANQLLCLLRPTSGSLQLDGIDVADSEVPAWQACCSYVPQSITLLNSNILENVAYGIDLKSIDRERVWDSLQAAQIADLVSDMPNGLLTSIGENGIRLSGGQRQRIAIARAFYRESKLLVLDEATSALDNQTEAQVMDSIELIGRRSTIVIIAHRLTTVMGADCIFEFENGHVKGSGTYQSLQENSATFRDMTDFDKNHENIINNTDLIIP